MLEEAHETCGTPSEHVCGHRHTLTYTGALSATENGGQLVGNKEPSINNNKTLVGKGINS